MLTSRAMRSLALSLAILLVTAAPALAGDNGEGVLGETDDKLVTFFSLGVLVFFVVLVIVGSLVQGALDRRKDEKKAHALRRREGW